MLVRTTKSLAKNLQVNVQNDNKGTGRASADVQNKKRLDPNLKTQSDRHRNIRKGLLFTFFKNVYLGN